MSFTFVPRYGPKYGAGYGVRNVIDKTGVPAAAPAFPTTLAEMATATGGYGTWVNQWRFQEGSGNCLDDAGGAGFSLVPANAPTQGAAGAIAGDLAIDMSPDGSTKRAVAAANTSQQHTTDDFAMYCVFKVNAAVAANRYFAGKIGAAGWYGIQINAGGSMLGICNDGTTTFTTTLAINHNDGNWHDCLLIIDRTNFRMRLQTDLGAAAEVDLTTALSFANTGFFGVGRSASVTGPISVTHLAMSSSTTNMRANAANMIAAFRSYTGR